MALIVVILAVIMSMVYIFTALRNIYI